MSRKVIGNTVTPSTTQEVSMLIQKNNGLDSLKNKLVYFDVETNSGSVHRAIGVIHEITTRNREMEDEYMRSILSEDNMSSDNSSKNDSRVVNFKIISTFSKDNSGAWSGNLPLPTSPSSGTPIYIADQDVLDEMFAHHDEHAISYLGHLRGGSDTLAPLVMPYYGGNRGASSIGFVGRTGSGKTDFASKVIINMMKYPDHFPLVVDPQGQWGSEVGFTISPQNTAIAMGRKVHNLRVSENIQLPLNEDNLLQMLSQIDLWSKVGRMAKENRDLLSQEVAELICFYSPNKINACKEIEDYAELLADVFETIMNSDSTIARIYASEDKQIRFRQSLYELVNPAEALIMSYINNNTRAIQQMLKEEGKSSLDNDIRNYAIEELLSNNLIRRNASYSEFGDTMEARCEYLADGEETGRKRRWDGILSKFIPLINLFQSHNLSDGERKPLAGHYGFLTEVLKVRNPKKDEPAPYVILDMSPDVTNKAKADLLNDNDPKLNMRRLLDNDNIKASILMMIFSSLKESAEEVFLSGGGNLNTQIVFDEAWRYAPDHSESEIIKTLSGMLEGFALDTRKFGIGWTYILQSPSDLRQGIWKQLKYVFAGYGLVGADLKRMSDLMDDPNEQLKTYKQFVAPDLSGEYPFMLVGSISPLITAQVPLFINSYTSVENFVSDNSGWLQHNMIQAGKNIATVDQMLPTKVRKTAKRDSKSYVVGGNVHVGAKSNYENNPNTNRKEMPNDFDELAPF